MSVRNAFGDSGSYFRTIPRGCISLRTGKLYRPPLDERQGGDPYRLETDEEYEARQVAYDEKMKRLEGPA